MFLTVVSKADMDSILTTYLTFLERIYFLQVENAYDVKRLIPVLSMF